MGSINKTSLQISFDGRKSTTYDMINVETMYIYFMFLNKWEFLHVRMLENIWIRPRQY